MRRCIRFISLLWDEKSWRTCMHILYLHLHGIYSQIDEQLAHAKYIYAGKRDIEQMKNLRKQMPSVFPLLVSLHKNTTNTDIGKL